MKKRNYIWLAYLGTDYVASCVALLIFSILRFNALPEIRETYGSEWNFLLSFGVQDTLLWFPPILLLIYYLTGYYIRFYDKSRVNEALRTFAAVVVASIIYFFVALLNDPQPTRSVSYELIGLFAICLFGCLYPARFALTSAIKSYYSNPCRRHRYALLCPADDSAAAWEKMATIARTSGFDIGARCALDGTLPHSDGDKAPWHPISSLGTLVKNGEIQGIVISPSVLEAHEIQRLLNTLYSLGVPVYVSPDDRSLAMGGVVRFEHVIGEPLVDITRPVLSDTVVAVKRFSDVVCSAVGLIVTMPVLAVLALIIKRQSPGPVFYSQERIGYHRRPFKIHKLRSMYLGSETDGPRLSSDQDPRITPIGRVMRKYRLDELPNLWNVLLGEMSMVGPRPERLHYISKIVERAPHYALLHQVRPGLTSWGMVRFGYASTVDQMIERLRYDILYIQNLSLEVDLKILFYTLRTILRGEGK